MKNFPWKSSMVMKKRMFRVAKIGHRLAFRCEAIAMQVDRFSRSKAFRDKESTGVVAWLIGATFDNIFNFDGEARLAFRQLIRYFFILENHRGVNSDGSGWNQSIHEYFNVVTIDALRRLWVKWILRYCTVRMLLEISAVILLPSSIRSGMTIPVNSLVLLVPVWQLYVIKRWMLSS
jgi:hypothetical protein